MSVYAGQIYKRREAQGDDFDHVEVAGLIQLEQEQPAEICIRWSDVSDKFVFCTSERTARTELADAIEHQGKRLAKRGIAFEVWDADELSLLLKGHEDIVQDFFGAYWVEAFFGKTGGWSRHWKRYLRRCALSRTHRRSSSPTNGHPGACGGFWNRCARMTPRALRASTGSSEVLPRRTLCGRRPSSRLNG